MIVIHTYIHVAAARGSNLAAAAFAVSDRADRCRHRRCRFGRSVLEVGLGPRSPPPVSQSAVRLPAEAYHPDGIHLADGMYAMVRREIWNNKFPDLPNREPSSLFASRFPIRRQAQTTRLISVSAPIPTRHTCTMHMARRHWVWSPSVRSEGSDSNESNDSFDPIVMTGTVEGVGHREHPPPPLFGVVPRSRNRNRSLHSRQERERRSPPRYRPHHDRIVPPSRQHIEHRVTLFGNSHVVAPAFSSGGGGGELTSFRPPSGG